MSAGRFVGGVHTQQKLQVLGDYLAAYAKALHEQRFVLVYIDAFAGSGNYSLDLGDAGILSGLGGETGLVTRPGSARMALAVEPSFNRLIFVDQDAASIAELQKIKAEHPNRDIRILEGEANDLVQRLCQRDKWRGYLNARGVRAVVFLDPFALSVDWETIEAIGKTEAIDLWYLFPINAVARLLARDARALEPANVDKLNKVLGGNWWYEDLYAAVTPEPDLFADPQEGGRYRHANVDQIEASFCARLQPHFGYVAPNPKRLYRNGQHLFSLFFCVANRSKAAVDLAKRISASILAK